jgi:hypothetical protein
MVQIIVAILVLGLGMLGWCAFVHVRTLAGIMTGTQEVRHIQIAMRNWAVEHNGNYPDSDASQPRTSNDAFRILIRDQVVSSEGPATQGEGLVSFGCPVSPYIPDNNIGSPPDYLEALKPGECHWVMTKGLRYDSPPDAPLVFENTAGMSWPPTWDCDAAGKPLPGRAWPGGKIIIGRNDGSIAPEKLDGESGAHVGLEQGKDGKDLFTRWKLHGEYLDIARP